MSIIKYSTTKQMNRVRSYVSQVFKKKTNLPI